MLNEKVEQLIATLEEQELVAPQGVVSVPIYEELFAAYLYKGDLPSARFLWRRIPGHLKSDAPQLLQIWSVHQALWQHNMPAFFAAHKFQWSTNVRELMTELHDRVMRETIDLIGLAYSSIFEDNLVKLVQLEPAVAEKQCKALGWVYEEGEAPRLVRPVPPVGGHGERLNAEAQLAKLTDFVSFLEN